MDLFDQHTPRKNAPPPFAPLPERVRPRTLDEFFGQEHLLGPGKPLRLLIEKGELPSIIFWGPPGSGKTTLAHILAVSADAEFFTLNAVAAGVADVRKVIERGEVNRKKLGKRTTLFIDEIHRFNKAQQDALLHSVEDGILTLVGATTENPSFEVIGPLLSRCVVYVLEALTAANLYAIVEHALRRDAALSKEKILLADDLRSMIVELSGGDARLLLNGIEIAVRLTQTDPAGTKLITRARFEDALQRKHFKYDKGGEEHYNIISAFIKCIRGSDPDAAVYWLARMLEGGEDPKFIARRMIVLASEDIGNADPSALTLATSCFTAVDYIGMPEARIVLAQAATYLASAPKSNASMLAIEGALADVRGGAQEGVPLHLRNAPTNLMKDLHYGKEYKYSHDFEEHFTIQQYLPDALKDRIYYRPTQNGAEASIGERLRKWWKGKKGA
jgi:putative ATPase